MTSTLARIDEQPVEIAKTNEEEWYEALVEECKAIITEAVFTSRWALVEGYHTLGKTISTNNNFDRKKVYGKKILQGLAKSISISERTLYYALQLYDKYPDIQKLPEGKNISWNKLVNKYLPLQKSLDKKSLTDLYIAPPFSILDTRQGYWQERKKQWADFGIKSEKGRDKNVQGDNVSTEGMDTGCEYFAPNISIFDPVLCEVVYKWFGFDGAKVLDPFAGGSVRGVVAEKLGLKYTGVDLDDKQIEANIVQAKKIGVNPDWKAGDSINIDKLVPNEYDLIFSCPPYFDLETYTNKEGELSNMKWGDFVQAYHKIIQKSIDMLKDNRFACFVAGDIRDKEGFYRNFINTTTEGFLESGVSLYNHLILIEQSGTAAMRAESYLKSSRKVVKTHQDVLVFYKGDPSKIKDIYNKIPDKEDL